MTAPVVRCGAWLDFTELEPRFRREIGAGGKVRSFQISCQRPNFLGHS